MKIFEHFPEQSKCPICKNNTDTPAVLIAVHGTNTDSKMTYEADVFHVKCIDLFYDKTIGIIYQRLK